MYTTLLLHKLPLQYHCCTTLGGGKIGYLSGYYIQGNIHKYSPAPHSKANGLTGHSYYSKWPSIKYVRVTNDISRMDGTWRGKPVWYYLRAQTGSWEGAEGGEGRGGRGRVLVLGFSVLPIFSKLLSSFGFLLCPNLQHFLNTSILDAY